MATQDEAPVKASELSEVLGRLVDLQESGPVKQVPIHKAKHVTPWNPEGKFKRPQLERKTYMNGHPMSENMMTEEEIKLANQLKPGKYQDRQWVVVHTDGEGDSEMFIYIPNKKLDQRMAMQSKAKSFVDICRLIIDEQKSSKTA